MPSKGEGRSSGRPVADPSSQRPAVVITAHVAERLTDLGYHVIPLLPASKKAADAGWQNLRLKVEDLPRYFKEGFGVGMLLGLEVAPGTYIVAIDVDVDDEDLIRNIRCALSDDPPGKRGSKGITFFVRVREQMKKKLFKRKDATGTLVNCVELLAHGQQTVMPPSIHPVTGQSYVWMGTPLINVYPEELPELDRLALREIELAVKEPEAKVFLLNTMTWLGEGKGGDVHNTVLTVTSSLVGLGFNDDEIWHRVDRATRRACEAFGDDYAAAFPTWESQVRKMIKDARDKNFDVPSRKEAPVVVAARWLLTMWRGHNRVFYRDGMLFAYQDGFYDSFSPERLRHIVAIEYKAQTSFDHGQLQSVVRTAMDLAPRFPKVKTDRVCLKNGTYDMNTGIFGEWSPDDYLISQMPFEYDPVAKTQLYDEVMERALSGHGDGDTAKARLCFEQFVAHSLLECLDYHKFLVIRGQPRTGKSTLVDLVKSIHAENAIASVPVHAFGDERYRTAMVGKLLNVVSEVEATTHAADGFLKSVTAGDLVSIRFLYAEPQHVRLPTRIMVACNEMFRIRDTSGAIEARMLLLSCDNFIAPKDRDIRMSDKLRKERSAIFNHLVRAWEQLLREGLFTEPSYSAQMIGEFSMENNHALQWVKERTTQGRVFEDPTWTPDKEAGTEQAILYLDYVDWAKMNGFKQMSSVSFGMKLSQIKVEGFSLDTVVRWVGGKAVRVRPLTLVTEGKF